MNPNPTHKNVKRIFRHIRPDKWYSYQDLRTATNLDMQVIRKITNSLRFKARQEGGKAKEFSYEFREMIAVLKNHPKSLTPIIFLPEVSESRDKLTFIHNENKGVMSREEADRMTKSYSKDDFDDVVALQGGAIADFLYKKYRTKTVFKRTLLATYFEEDDAT